MLKLVLGGALVIVVVSLVLPEAWLVSVMLQPGGDWWLVGQNSDARQRAQEQGLLTVPIPGRVPGVVGGAPQRGVSTSGQLSIPADHLAAIQQAAQEAPCQLDWSILAGVGHQESGFGTNANTYVPHTGGIVGETQFSPDAWTKYGDGAPLGPATPLVDQYLATARYLCALGVTTDPTAALGHYSGCWPCGRTDAYPQQVLAFAASVSQAVTSSASSALQAVVDEARTWFGVPYLLGGRSRAAIDCSALVWQVFQTIGIDLPPLAQTQDDLTTPTSSPQPGELVFFQICCDRSSGVPNHVGIYAGNGRMIHAPEPGDVVREVSIDTPFWRQAYYGAGRGAHSRWRDSLMRALAWIQHSPPREVPNVLSQYVVVLERDAAGALVSAHVGVPLIDQYLSYLTAIGRAPTTISSYAYDLVLFCRWLATAEPVTDLEPALRSLSTAQVFAYVEHTCRSGTRSTQPAPATVYRRVVALAKFYDWAEAIGVIARNPVPRDRPRGPRGRHHFGRPASLRVPALLPRPAPTDEIAAFSATFRTWRDRALLALLVGAGLRLSEALGLRLVDLDWGGRQVFVRRGKGGRQRYAMAPDPAWAALKAYLDQERPALLTQEFPSEAAVFVVLHGPRRGQPLTAAGVQSLFRHHRRRAQTPNVTPHRLRHTCGTELHRAGLALEFLQEQLGHRRLESTRLYVHLSNERLRAAYAAIQPRLYRQASEETH
jgi:site-specific recombinase XerD/cell wall-associated NlpC family hydrolase